METGTPSEVLAELRRARVRRRMGSLDVWDTLYNVYVAAIFGGAVLLMVSRLVGGEILDDTTPVLRHGQAVAGLGVALAIAMGLRTGARGGPIAVDPADVRFVLMGPVPRRTALFRIALKHLRTAAFAGTVAGACAGLLASQRLAGGAAAWIGSGALFGLASSACRTGAAMLASGMRLSMMRADVLAAIALAGSVVDVVGATSGSPLTGSGRLALLPLGAGVTPVAFAVPVVLASAGALLAHGVSIEACERRARLVSLLRFAATVQDVRSVIMLRHQLAAELPRSEPWIGLRPGDGVRWSVWKRGWQSVFRWPVARVVRFVSLAAAAGVSLRYAGEVSPWLIGAAGLCAYVAALDAVQPLGQETDLADRREMLPFGTGDLRFRHLAAPAIAMAAFAAVAFAVSDPPSGLLFSVPAGAAAACGAALAVAAPSLLDDPLMLPEAMTSKIMIRLTWPPAVAACGFLPAFDGLAVFVTVIVAGLAAIWLRRREDIVGAFKAMVRA